MPDGRRQVGLAHAAGAKQQHVAALAGPLRGAGQGVELPRRQARDLGEVEARQALARGQTRFGGLTGDTPAVALGELLLTQGREVLGPIPAVLPGLF